MDILNKILAATKPFPKTYEELKEEVLNKRKNASIDGLKKEIHGIENAIKNENRTEKNKTQLKYCIKILYELIAQKNK